MRTFCKDCEAYNPHGSVPNKGRCHKNEASVYNHNGDSTWPPVYDYNWCCNGIPLNSSKTGISFRIY